MTNDIDIEKILKCRCSECETEKQRLCQSGHLRQLLGDLFDDEASSAKVPGLYCRGKMKSETQTIGARIECLCDECELMASEGGYFCQAVGD
jgi:hypothetical protein